MCDVFDVCEYFADGEDGDEDGVPDGCDPCPLELADSCDDATTFAGLGRLGGDESAASAVSANGRVVVGWSDIAGNVWARHAFRWTDAGMVSLGAAFTVTDPYSEATAVSANGNAVVGFSQLEALGPSYDETGKRAFLWTPSGGRIDFAGTTYAALAISPDATFIVGYAGDHDEYRTVAQFWDGQLHALGQQPNVIWPGERARAVAASRGGALVAGWFSVPPVAGQYDPTITSFLTNAEGDVVVPSLGYLPGSGRSITVVADLRRRSGRGGPREHELRRARGALDRSDRARSVAHYRTGRRLRERRAGGGLG